MTVCFFGCQLPFKQSSSTSEHCFTEVTNHIMQLLSNKSKFLIKRDDKDEFPTKDQQ